MMKKYREFSSLTAELGISIQTLYSVSNHLDRHYYKTEIPKQNGEERILTVPDELLKFIQRRIADCLLSRESVSPYATAYRTGSSVKENARPHLAQPMVLKLDIKGFFDHIIYPLVKKKAFPKERYEEPMRVLLTLLCVYKEVLPQGAPTSPVISNIIMRDFDNKVGAWCEEKGICYTRYCDDMAFSGNFVPRQVIDLVRKELSRMGLFLNNRKTTLVGSGQKQMVTGVVVNEKLNTTISYRKKIRQEIYFCKKYGIASHLLHHNQQGQEMRFLRSLLGRIQYVLMVDPENREMQENKDWVIGMLKKFEKEQPIPLKQEPEIQVEKETISPMRKREPIYEPDCGKIIKGRRLVVGRYLRISAVTGDCPRNMEEVERIHVEEEAMESFLLWFMRRYYNPEFENQIWENSEAEDCQWLWNSYLYSTSSVAMMLEEIRSAGLLLEKGDPHERLDELKEYFYEEDNSETAVAFYSDFYPTMRNMMDRNSECKLFAFQMIRL